MKIPTIHGFIDRRILINFTADPEVVSKIVPAPFCPKIYKGKAIVGICLIRLKDVKPFNKNSIFETIENVSAFFEKGAIGYSPNKDKFDGLQLQTYNWAVKPLDVINVQSSFFEDENLFPKGSVTFDNALLMTHIEHEWHSVEDKFAQK